MFRKGNGHYESCSCGAFGNLGCEILKKLAEEGHEIVAAGRTERTPTGTEGRYTFRHIDSADPTTLNGLCDGADIVITTLGPTAADPTGAIAAHTVWRASTSVPKKSSNTAKPPSASRDTPVRNTKKTEKAKK